MPVKNIQDMPLDGGFPCLDFVNSGFDEEEGVIVERIHTYEDLLVLAKRTRLLSSQQCRELGAIAKAGPAKAVKELKLARQVRLRMFRVLRAIAEHELPSLEREVLDQFNIDIKRALAARSFVVNKGLLREDWKTPEPDPGLPLRGFVLSAHELLTTRDQHYIRKCSGCEWLFIDVSKSHRRKWCNMQSCGSMAKSRNYYQRNKKN